MQFLGRRTVNVHVPKRSWPGKQLSGPGIRGTLENGFREGAWHEVAMMGPNTATTFLDSVLSCLLIVASKDI